MLEDCERVNPGKNIPDAGTMKSNSLWGEQMDSVVQRRAKREMCLKLSEWERQRQEEREH